jgi:hypothetical protein
MSCMRDNLPEFPHLDKELVNIAIKEGLKKQQNSRYELIFINNLIEIFVCFLLDLIQLELVNHVL